MIEALTFDDVLIKPRLSKIASRADVDLSFNGDRFPYMELPIISANMDTITGDAMARAMLHNGAQACLHRFCTIEENVEMFQKSMYGGTGGFRIPMVSIGLGKKELDRAKALFDAGAFTFIVDVAHGASMGVVNQVKALRDMLNDRISVVVGNFATGDSVKDFLEICPEVEGFKVGIGPGCFASGTRILMSNGTYKNIEDIKLHDKVINKDGNPVDVIGVKFSGFRKVSKYKNNNFYKETYCTSDHRHWVGDYSTTKNIQNVSLREVLDQPTRTDESKYKWKELKDSDNSVFLLPKKINFDLPKSFKFNLDSFTSSKRTFNKGEMVENKDIGPSYDLGYIFGTFLGDGNASIETYDRKVKGTDKITKNTCGKTAWAFGKNEMGIAEKVQKSIETVFGFNTKIQELKNILLVTNHNNNLTRLFKEFGKRDNKNLPEKYLCDNPEYLKGLYDGMMDSDGSYGKDGRLSFGNTSNQLIELFSLIAKIVNGQYPSISTRPPTAGGLTNCNVENCKESYVCRTVTNPEFNLTKEYQVCRVYKIEETNLVVPTYDIEVDCDTHSFIANNVIVHNSLCTTRIKTGCGYPQLSAIMEISEVLKKTGIPVIADGGIKTPGDCAKALGAGASMLMIGGMFAGTYETPGEIVDQDGNPVTSVSFGEIRKVFKKYRGSASQESYEAQGKTGSHRTAEGESTFVPYKGPIKDILQDIEGGLRSAFSYVGACNLKEFHDKVEFVRVSNSTKVENGAHLIKK